MAHAIEVHLSANVEKFNQGMAAAKKTSSESMGFIASIFNTVKSYFAGMWDSAKLFFSNLGDKAGSAWGSFKDSASSALEKVLSMLPGVGKATKDIGDEADQADKKTDSWLSKLGSGLTAIVAAAAAVAIAIAALAAKGMLVDSAFAKLSISSDIGAGALSKFESVAMRSGICAQDMTASMVALREEMKKGQAGDTGIFQTLGIKITDANGALRQTDEVTVEVAKKIAAMSSEAEKYNAAATLGFGGKVQLLEDIAHAGTLTSGTTDEQAAAMVRLGKIWHDILPGGKSMWAEISTFLSASFTPAITAASISVLESKSKIVDAFQQIFNTSPHFEKYGETIKEWANSAAKWFDSVAKASDGAAVGIMKFIAQKTGLGDPNAFKPSIVAVPGTVPLADGKAPVDQKALDAYAAENKAIREKIDAMKLETDAGATLTEGQAKLSKMLTGLRDGTLQYTDAQKIERIGMLSLQITQEQAAIQSRADAAASASAIKKEAEAYATITSAIAAKIVENKAEVALGIAATESQRMSARLDAEQAAGKRVLTAEHLAAAKAQLIALAASEKEVALSKAQIEVDKYIAAGTITRQESIDSLDVEYKAYGKSADAREMLMVAVKAEAEMQKEIQKMKDAHTPADEAELARLEHERNLRVAIGEATLGQSKALAYATQLADENKKFVAESLYDEKQRAAALLAIDAKIWQERIQNAGAGTEAQKAIQTQYDVWHSNQSLKPQIEEQRKIWTSIESTAHDTFVSIFDSGKSAFDRLRDTLKNGLLDLLYQMTIKKWILNIGASVGMTGGAAGLAQAATGGATGASGLIGAAQSASSIYNAITTGFARVTAGIGTGIVGLGGMLGSSGLAAFGAGVGSTGIVGAGSAAGLYAAAGGTGSAGLVSAGAYSGAAITAAAGIAAGVLGGNLISGQFGSNATVNGGTAVGAIAGAIFGGPLGAAVGGALGGVVGGTLNRLFGMGDKKVTAQGLRGTLADSGATGEAYSTWTQKGGLFRSDKGDTDKTALTADVINSLTAGFASLKTVSGDFAKNLDIDGASILNYSKAFNIALTSDAAANQEAITKFFSGLGDEMAVQLVPSIAAFALVGETASATLQRLSGDFAATNTLAGLLGKTGVEAFGSMGMASAAARERLIELTGGLAALGTQTAFFAQNFLTEAQRLAPVTKALDAAMASLGLSSIKTRTQFADVVMGLDLTTDAGAKQYAALMSLQEAFAQVHTEVVDLAAAEKAISDERKGLQDQLNELTKSEIALQAIARDGIADINKGLYDQVQAAKAVTTAKDALSKAYSTEAAAAQTAIDKSKGWVSTLNGLNPSLAMGSLSTLTPEQKYAEAQAQFERTLAAANAGDATAQGGLSAAEQAFLTASQVVNASDAKYTADYARVQAANVEAMRWAQAQVDVQQASLDALTKQVSGLITINDSVLTVAQAIANLQVAMGGAASLGVKFDGSHAGGLTDVPFDGYMAQTHRGEAIVDAPAMSAIRRYFGGAPSQGGGNTDALVAEIKSLRDEVKGLREDQDKQTGGLIQATFQSNDQNAKAVVAGVDKSAKASVWANKNEVIYG